MIKYVAIIIYNYIHIIIIITYKFIIIINDEDNVDFNLAVKVKA